MKAKLTKNYEHKNFYLQKKAEYSYQLIFVMLCAIIFILMTEFILHENIVNAGIKSLVSIAMFGLVFLLIYKGFYEIGINLMILLGFSRLIMLFNYDSLIQFYIMMAMNLIAVSVIYCKQYQTVFTNILSLLLALAQSIRIFRLVRHGQIEERMFVETIVTFYIILAIILMLRYIRNIINREIHERNTIKRLAERDPLTDLYNRRKITEIYSAIQANGLDIKVILFDIDDFKIINDTYGHQLGDQILTELSALIRDRFSSLPFARWGGEEFLILVDDGLDYSEDIRKIVMNHRFSDQISITVSLGQTTASINDTISAATKRADKAMYLSKESGKNKTTIYENIR